jgi:hypothetical protein
VPTSASVKSVHQGIVTACRAGEILGFSFKAYSTGADPDTVRDGAGNVVTSVTRSAAGKYSVQLTKPYPRQLVAGVASLELPDGATADERAFVVSYTASTGILLIQILVDDGSPAVGDPTTTGRINFLGLFIGTGGNSLVQS